MQKEEYPCVSTSAIHVCVCVCVQTCMYYRLKGEKGKCITVRQNGKKKGVIARDHYGSKKQQAVSELMM